MATAESEQFKVIGTRPIRQDGVEKVTGRARFGADYSFPNMLYGKVLRSPHAHARVKSIRFEKALALPGVKAVVTAKELPELEDRMQQFGEMPMNPCHVSHNILARDKVVYDGHALAAVAATSPHIAEEALRLIEVDYEPLPPVMTVEDAMRPQAPIILPKLRNPEEGDRPTNVAKHTQIKQGDPEAGFKAADFIVEREFKTAMVHQGYIEPQSAIGIYNQDGYATVYCSTQGPFEARGCTAMVLGMPPGHIKVVPTEVGGGFGGKVAVYLEPLAVLLSKKTGHPVKMVMTRGEVLRATGPAPGSKIRFKMGCTKAGKITAAQVWMADEAGAFPGSWVDAGALTILGPYTVANLLIDAYDVVVNRPKTSTYRAPGAPNAAFAAETVIDELAEKCGIDPLEFRIMNGAREGTPHPAGFPHGRIGFIETCEAIRNSAHYKSKLEGPNRGRGVASAFWFNAGMQSSATVNIHEDGSVSVVTGSPDLSGTRMTCAMMAAEVLGIPVEDVRPVVTDTDSVGHTDLTAGSRVTFATGTAVYEAAKDAVRQLKERAAQVWEKQFEEVEFRDGKLFLRDNGRPPMTIRELASWLRPTGGPITGRATVNPRGVGPTFVTTCVDVEVDPETGKTQLLRVTAAQDVGRAIHPGYVEGQIQGATAQGLGWGLTEEYFYDEKGALRNTALLDYRIPTCVDLPMIEAIIVEVPNPGHPLGVRGVGEGPIIPPPAAAANAVYHATGVRMTELPMSPPRLLKAILEKRGGAKR